MSNSWPPQAGGARLVGKVNTAGQSVASATLPSSGAWAELVASTSVDYYIVGCAYVDSGAGDPRTSPPLISIGIGAAGSETSLCDTFVMTSAYAASIVAAFMAASQPFVVPVRVSSGTRLSIRSSVVYGTVGTAAFAAAYLVPYAAVEGN